MRGGTTAVLVGLVLLGAACSGGGGDDEAEAPDCPTTTTTGSPAASETTTTVDPDCVIGAEEATDGDEETADGTEVWEGTIETTVTAPAAGPVCPNPSTVSGTVRLEVAPDGAVTGSYDLTGCAVSVPHAEFTGTADEAGFSFPQLIVFTNGELIPKVSPEQADATLTNVQGGTTTWETVWDLRCTSC